MTYGGLSAAVVGLVDDLTFDLLPDDAVTTVKAALADWVACAVAGSNSEPAAIVRDHVRGHGARGSAPLIGSGELVAPTAAALANGTAGHALDLDDFSRTMFHSSVVLAPPLFALASEAGASGMDVIAAYAAGFEVAARSATALGRNHYSRGWHITSTVGTVAAAIGAAKLLGGSRTEMLYTLGIAGSSAGGLRDNFGTMVKPLHAGLAAENATRSALLARGGLTASTTIMEAEHGFLQVFGAGDQSPFDLSTDRLELSRSGISFKRHACCGAMHPAIDLVLDLLSETGLAPHRISRIDCTATALAPEIIRFPTPRTPEEARFSFEWALAVSASDGLAGPRQFTAERLRDPEVRRLASNVSVRLSRVEAGPRFPATVTVETTDGASVSRQGGELRGYPETPFSDEELAEKFLACATVGLSGPDADELLEELRGLERLASMSRVNDLLLRVRT